MRIENVTPSFNTASIQIPVREIFPTPAETEKAGSLYGGVIVEISPQAKAAYNQSIAQAASSEKQGGTQGITAANGLQECQTCKDRKYVDGSDDPSVSFQAPTHISPQQAPAMVMSHEREHVANEQAKAEQDGRKIISQTVALSSSICPECGRIYISGGVTRTLSVDDNSESKPEPEIS